MWEFPNFISGAALVIKECDPWLENPSDQRDQGRLRPSRLDGRCSGPRLQRERLLGEAAALARVARLRPT